MLLIPTWKKNSGLPVWIFRATWTQASCNSRSKQDEANTNNDRLHQNMQESCTSENCEKTKTDLESMCCYKIMEIEVLHEKVGQHCSRIPNLSINGVQSHLHTPTHASIYLGMLSSLMQNLIWWVNHTPTLQQVSSVILLQIIHLQLQVMLSFHS